MANYHEYEMAFGVLPQLCGMTDEHVREYAASLYEVARAIEDGSRFVRVEWTVIANDEGEEARGWYTIGAFEKFAEFCDACRWDSDKDTRHYLVKDGKFIEL